MIVNIHTPDDVPLCDSPIVLKKGLIIIKIILSQTVMHMQTVSYILFQAVSKHIKNSFNTI